MAKNTERLNQLFDEIQERITEYMKEGGTIICWMYPPDDRPEGTHMLCLHARMPELAEFLGDVRASIGKEKFKAAFGLSLLVTPDVAIDHLEETKDNGDMPTGLKLKEISNTVH